VAQQTAGKIAISWSVIKSYNGTILQEKLGRTFKDVAAGFCA